MTNKESGEKLQAALAAFNDVIDANFSTVVKWDVGVGLTSDGFDKKVADGTLFIRIAGKLKKGIAVYTADSLNAYIAE